MEPIPDSCLKFDKRVREIASVSDTKVTSDKALYRLRPSARQLAQLAEQTKEFEQLVIDLFRSGPADTYESEVVADLIKRCGYYHSVLDAEPPEVYWRKIVDRIPNREREVKRLRLLLGCRFPRDRFSIAGHSIVRMSASELAALGPDPRAARDFFPEERLARWLTERWLVEEGTVEWTGYVFEGDLHSSLGPEIRMTYKEIAASKRYPNNPRKRALDHIFGCPELPNYIAPILILSLYDSSFFEIPLGLVCQPGWRLLKSGLSFESFTSANHIVERPVKYDVPETAWVNFERLLRRCESGLASLRFCSSRRRFVTAARHYLRATFAGADVWYQWDTSWLSVDYPAQSGREPPDNIEEDVLLHYVFALEALFTKYDSDSKKGRKLATCVSKLVATSDEERAYVTELVVKAYRARSSLVHGQSPSPDKIDLLNLRKVVQRALSAILFLAAAEPKIKKADLHAEVERILKNVDPALAEALGLEIPADEETEATDSLIPGPGLRSLSDIQLAEESGVRNPTGQSQVSVFSATTGSPAVSGEIERTIDNLWTIGTLLPKARRARDDALELLAGGNQRLGYASNR